MCVVIFSTNLSQTSFFVKRIQRDIMMNAYVFLRKVLVILVRFS